MTTKELSGSPFVDGFVFGEGPRWHDGQLWFTDGPGGAVLAADTVGRTRVVVEVERPSGLGWLPDGTLVVSTAFVPRIDLVDPDNAMTSHDLSAWAWSTNDVVVSEDGRIYVDLYRRRGDQDIDGAIGLFTPDSGVRVMATDLTMPNGLAITPDGSTLIASDTFDSKLVAFTIGSNGDLIEPRVFADLGPDRHPDGICLDEAGAVWVGCYDTGEFLRIHDGGEVTHRVLVDGWAVAPALGGEDRRTLYLVVNHTTIEDYLKGQSRGRIEHLRVDTPGAGRP
jgi:sugar lactone lactonase YvrE